MKLGFIITVQRVNRNNEWNRNPPPLKRHRSSKLVGPPRRLWWPFLRTAKERSTLTTCPKEPQWMGNVTLTYWSRCTSPASRNATDKSVMEFCFTRTLCQSTPVELRWKLCANVATNSSLDYSILQIYPPATSTSFPGGKKCLWGQRFDDDDNELTAGVEGWFRGPTCWLL